MGNHKGFRSPIQRYLSPYPAVKRKSTAAQHNNCCGQQDKGQYTFSDKNVNIYQLIAKKRYTVS